jgi:hypothetical protein
MHDPIVELVQPILGLHPYILIECPPSDSPAGFDMKVRAGGGIEDRDHITGLLLLAVEELTGVPVDLYVQQVDVVRRAASLPPLDGVVQ